MKLLLKYTSVLCYVLLFVSCSLDEHGMGTDASYETVEIIARPTSFFSEDLTTKSDYLDWEKEIHSLYLLIFNNVGERVAFIDDVNLKTTLKYKFSFDSQPFSVCALANVPKSVAEAYNPLTETPSSCSFEFDYNTDWTPCITLEEKTTYTCLPMYGFQQSTEVKGNKLIIDLQSLFAKFTFSLSDDNEYSFAMDSKNGAIINKLPRTVYLDANYNERQPTFTTDNITLSSPTETVIYVPEYILTGKNSGTELGKPEGAPADALYLTLSGIISGSCPSSRIQYKVYLGDNNSTSYSLMRNTYYDNQLTVKGIANALNRTDQRVNYIGHNLADPTCSGTEEAANCYIISQPGRYIFPAVKGAGIPKNLGAATGSIGDVISDGNNSINEVKRVNVDGKEDPNGAYISFDVTSVNDGNLVLPVNDWSWHLWFCKNHGSADAPFRPDDEDLLNTYGDFKVMDRALGATESVGYDVNIPSIDGNTNGDDISIKLWNDGLYYKNGSNNPFIEGKYAGVESSGTWSDTKSSTDPCPPGYKVPSTDIWTTSINSGTMEEILSHITTEAFAYNIEVSTDFTKNILYPFSGYMYYSQDQKSYLVNSGFKTYFKETTRRKKEDSLGSYLTYRIEYDGYDYAKTGYLWANNGELYYARKGTIVESSDVFIYIAYNDTWYPRDPDEYDDGYDVTKDKKNIENAINEVLSDLYKKAGSGIAGSIAKAAIKAIQKVIPNLKIDETMLNVLNTLTTLEFDYSKTSKPDSTPDNHGAQIRCVVDGQK